VFVKLYCTELVHWDGSSLPYDIEKLIRTFVPAFLNRDNIRIPAFPHTPELHRLAKTQATVLFVYYGASEISKAFITHELSIRKCTGCLQMHRRWERVKANVNASRY